MLSMLPDDFCFIFFIYAQEVEEEALSLLPDDEDDEEHDSFHVLFLFLFFIIFFQLICRMMTRSTSRSMYSLKSYITPKPQTLNHKP